MNVLYYINLLEPVVIFNVERSFKDSTFRYVAIDLVATI